LNLESNKVLSTFAFDFNVRRHTKDSRTGVAAAAMGYGSSDIASHVINSHVHPSMYRQYE